MEVSMSDKKQKSTLSVNVLREMGDYFRLIMRLMGDSRVSPILKLLPVGTLVYLINPFDIPGPLDDMGVIGLGLYMFVEMCPPAIVEEHRQALRGVIDGTAHDPEVTVNKREDNPDVIDAEFREEK
jgi:hypothetical protein